MARWAQRRHLTGATAFKYLAPYIFWVAISNSRLLKVKNDSG